jgi:hypothetical protein
LTGSQWCQYASALRHQAQSGTAGPRLVRHCPALQIMDYGVMFKKDRCGKHLSARTLSSRPMTVASNAFGN